MIYSNYNKDFTEKALNNGFSQEQINKCLDYALPLVDKGLPVIYDTENLSALIGYKTNYLKRAVLFSTYFYTQYAIKKKNGKGTRVIHEPLPSLKEIQVWILHNILNNVPVSRFAKAYVKKSSIVENVKYHRNKDFIVCLDIKDFFPSITSGNVEKVFNDLGYSSKLSNLLSKLCCRNEKLVQGSPTSPALSNIIMKDFDDLISIFCIANSFRYTRFADDLTFSYSINPTAETNFTLQTFKDTIITNVWTILQKTNPNLRLNKDKTQILKNSDRQIVTGVIVNNKNLNTPIEYRKKIRQEIYYIKKYTLNGHLERTQNNKENYLRHLLGKIRFSLYINKNDKKMIEYRDFIKSKIE